MINKKRGYRSSRKTKSADEGEAVDGMEVAKWLYDHDLTPGEYAFSLLSEGKKVIPDFYRSDLQQEFDRIWEVQRAFYPDLLTDDFKRQITGSVKRNTTKIFLARYGIFTAENKGKDKRLQEFQWRVKALSKQLSKEELAYVISDLNGAISGSSGYLGAISDRSKELYFAKQTVGQYLMAKLEKDPNGSITNQVFYRQDYMDEFERIWETQAAFHPQLTPSLKKEIRDVVIFFQRPLKSQKKLLSFCEFEVSKKEVVEDGITRIKTIGSRVCPKSAPLFQKFKIWQSINNLRVIDDVTDQEYELDSEKKLRLFEALSIRNVLKDSEILKILYPRNRVLKLNLEVIDGNRTFALLYAAFKKILYMKGADISRIDKQSAKDSLRQMKEAFEQLGYNSDVLFFDSSLDKTEFENQSQYRLWHLLYSFEGDSTRTGNGK